MMPRSYDPSEIVVKHEIAIIPTISGFAAGAKESRVWRFERRRLGSVRAHALKFPPLELHTWRVVFSEVGHRHNRHAREQRRG